MSATEPLPADTRAWTVEHPGPVGGPAPGPLVWERRPLDAPGPVEDVMTPTSAHPAAVPAAGVLGTARTTGRG
ncbi:hypothetical protein [Kitasatospora sp. NPDC005856]|uniref:hypothetical protein n=1 Tax=Kitasatospora sp. NPDC005856 TaxID=3154566 RepID=UPI0033CD3A64